MSWGSPAWNWGSANGKAHDEAAKLRGALATEAQRVDYLAAAKEGAYREVAAIDAAHARGELDAA